MESFNGSHFLILPEFGQNSDTEIDQIFSYFFFGEMSPLDNFFAVLDYDLG